jgi:hypothetical protein
MLQQVFRRHIPPITITLTLTNTLTYSTITTCPTNPISMALKNITVHTIKPISTITMTLTADLTPS